MAAPRVDVEALRRNMDATRTRLARTAQELRMKAGEAMDWRTYVERFPWAILGTAVGLGLLAGRAVGHIRPASPHAVPDRPPQDPAGNGAGRPGVTSVAWQRAAGHVETLANRVIDDVADAVQAAVVPAVVGGVRAFLAGTRPAPGRRPVAPEADDGRSAFDRRP